MEKSQVLKERLEDVIVKQGDLLTLATSESREFTDAEQSVFDGYEAEVKRLEAEVRKAEVRENAEMRANSLKKEPKKVDEAKVNERYSFTKAIRETLHGRGLTGLEKEMHEEASKESTRSGVTLTGIGIPSMMIDIRTTLESSTAATAANTIPTNLQGFIPALRPNLIATQLGATIYENLSGNIDIPRRDTDSVAAWEGETAEGAESNPTYGKIQLRPHRLGGYTVMTKQMLFQNSIGVENDVRDSLSFAIKKAVDTAYFYGQNGDDPLGILGTGSIGSVAMGTNGAAPTFAKLIEMETACNTENALTGQLAYVTTPGIKGFLKSLAKDAGSGQMVWANEEVNGYRAFASNSIPKTLTKGGSGANCHAILFGNFADSIIASWSGIDLVLDPYTGALNNYLKIWMNSWWDVAVKHPKSFVAILDALAVDALP